MKNLFIIFALLFVVTGCTQFTTGVTPVQCTIYKDFGATPENSIIASKISNPCLASDLIVVAAKMPVIWEKKYGEEFDKWATKMEVILNNGVTFTKLRDIVTIEIAKLNKEIGLTFLAISPIINQFDETGMLLPIDIEMCLALIKKLRREVAQMAALAQ